MIIKLSVQSKKKEVTDFLSQLHMILRKEDFDIDTDITLIRSKKEDEKYSTLHTLLDLDYDTSDVVQRLQELTIEEYSETFPYA